jgi:hypothetical protein
LSLLRRRVARGCLRAEAAFRPVCVGLPLGPPIEQAALDGAPSAPAGGEARLTTWTAYVISVQRLDLAAGGSGECALDV